MLFIIVREVITDNLAICRIPTGHSFPADPAFRWAGFWDTEKKARAALEAKDESTRKQLYGEPVALTGTPGPKSLSELFKF